MNNKNWNYIEYIWDLTKEYPQLTIGQILVKFNVLLFEEGGGDYSPDVPDELLIDLPNHLGPDVIGDFA